LKQFERGYIQRLESSFGLATALTALVRMDANKAKGDPCSI
jgi:hypothetical protein